MPLIKVAAEFGPLIFERSSEHGTANGKSLRLAIEAALAAGEIVEVDLTGVLLGPSASEEAFGGVGRSRAFSTQDLRRRLKIVAKDQPVTAEEAWSFLLRALSS